MEKKWRNKEKKIREKGKAKETEVIKLCKISHTILNVRTKTNIMETTKLISSDTQMDNNL